MTARRDDVPQATAWLPNPYFGEPWAVPAVEGARQVPTPVGLPCAWCGVAVEDGDQGFLIPGPGADGQARVVAQPWHRERLLRTVLGPAAHLDGACFCRTGEPDQRAQTPQQLRAEAIEVWDRIQSGRVGGGTVSGGRRP